MSDEVTEGLEVVLAVVQLLSESVELGLDLALVGTIVSVYLDVVMVVTIASIEPDNTSRLNPIILNNVLYHLLCVLE